jgi:Leucine-rich repeat (LRR) protein
MLIFISLILLSWIVYSLTLKCKQIENNKKLLKQAHREKIKNKIEEIKMIQSHPKFFIANYFSDLKRQVDLEFAFKLDETDKYMKIISTIELAEQDCYYQIKPFNKFNNEIDEAQINNIDNLTIKLLNDLKFKIEKEIFKNKSIIFIENFNYKKFLLIINDKHLRKGTITSEYLKTNTDIINNRLKRENLFDFILIQTIFNSNDAIIKLNTNLIHLTEINFSNNQINVIHENTFHGLINLTDLNFKTNQIQKIYPKTFKGLINLKRINFEFNRINYIYPNTFNGLTSLIHIHFGINCIEELHPSTFKDLINLKIIDFQINRIHEIKKNIFTGLISLEIIKFGFNYIQKLHPNIFNGLINLKKIDFCANKIKEIYTRTFDGLISLQKIELGLNKIQELHPNIFNGLINLEEISIFKTKIKDLNLSTFDGLPKLRFIIFLMNLIKDHQYLSTIRSQLKVKGINFLF